MFDITYTKEDIKKAEKRGWQRGYIAGRNYIGYGLTIPRLLKELHKLRGKKK